MTSYSLAESCIPLFKPEWRSMTLTSLYPSPTIAWGSIFVLLTHGLLGSVKGLCSEYAVYVVMVEHCAATVRSIHGS